MWLSCAMASRPLGNRRSSPEHSAVVRSWVFEIADVRNSWAHQDKKLARSSDDALRALDTMERLLEAFGNSDQRGQIRTMRRDLMRQVFEEESRGERRRTAAQATAGHPAAGAQAVARTHHTTRGCGQRQLRAGRVRG